MEEIHLHYLDIYYSKVHLEDSMIFLKAITIY